MSLSGKQSDKSEARTQPRKAILRLAVSRCITYSGGNAAFVALLAVLYEKTNSSGVVALGAIACFAVPALVSPMAGALGDRVDRKVLLVSSELLGALCFVCMALANSVGALIILRVCASVASAPLAPATSAALPAITNSPRELARANARLEIWGTIGGLAGPLAAAVLIPTIGAGSVFVINAFTFVISALLIASIRVEFQCRGRKLHAESHALASGLRFIARNRPLAFIATANAIVYFGIGATVPAELALSFAFGVGAAGYAGLVFMWALGRAAAAYRTGRRPDSQARGPFLLAAAAVTTGYFAIAVAPHFAIPLLAMALVGAGDGIWQVAQPLLIQTATPDRLRGRVFAASEAGAQAAIAAGLMLSGALVAGLGAAGAFGVAAAICASAFLFLGATFHKQILSSTTLAESRASRRAGRKLAEPCPSPPPSRRRSLSDGDAVPNF